MCLISILRFRYIGIMEMNLSRKKSKMPSIQTKYSDYFGALVPFVLCKNDGSEEKLTLGTH